MDPLTPVTPLSGTLLMRLSVQVGDIVSLGALPSGERRFVAITGGEAEGAGDLAGWRAMVRPGGADWQWLRPDGVLEVDARYVLEDAHGERVQVRSRGLRHGPPDVLAALACGDAVDPSRYYFRTALRFEASAPALQRLNCLIAIGIGRREARCVRLAVHAVD
jgi:hypothetical protein